MLDINPLISPFVFHLPFSPTILTLNPLQQQTFNSNHNHNTLNTSPPQTITMKFTSVLIVAAGSLVAAQDTSTGGGLFSSITNAGSILSSATSAPGKTSLSHLLILHQRETFN
jgi:hypothetical protein